jgi:hypothetical protein
MFFLRADTWNKALWAPNHLFRALKALPAFNVVEKNYARTKCHV